GEMTEDWSKIPVFGERPEADAWVIRPSACGLIEGEGGRLAVVRTDQGMFLPGGGIEAGETPEQAISREALEECGLVIHSGEWKVRAVQFVFSASERTHFEKRSTFIECVVVGLCLAGSEAGHELIWVLPESAAQILSNESQRWAVERWRSRLTDQ